MDYLGSEKLQERFTSKRDLYSMLNKDCGFKHANFIVHYVPPAYKMQNGVHRMMLACEKV